MLCLAVISLDSAPKKDDNYYPQVLLKECKYIEKKVVRHIHDNLNDFLILLMSLMKNKYSNWLLYIVLLKCKYAYKLSYVESYFFQFIHH